MILFLLPGFLGRPADFAEFQQELSQRRSDIEPQVFDWLNAGEEILASPLDRVGAAIYAELSRSAKGRDFAVLGYSLGGRLLLSLREELHRRAEMHPLIFVATNPGLGDENERRKRREADSRWAARFRGQEWNELLAEWNAQGVFKDSRREPARMETDYRRDDLGRILTLWSLAEQGDHRPSLRQKLDYTWITGALDAKFCQLAADLPAHIEVAGAAHRVPVDAPAGLADVVAENLPRSNSSS